MKDILKINILEITDIVNCIVLPVNIFINEEDKIYFDNPVTRRAALTWRQLAENHRFALKCREYTPQILYLKGPTPIISMPVNNIPKDPFNFDMVKDSLTRIKDMTDMFNWGTAMILKWDDSNDWETKWIPLINEIFEEDPRFNFVEHHPNL